MAARFVRAIPGYIALSLLTAPATARAENPEKSEGSEAKPPAAAPGGRAAGPGAGSGVRRVAGGGSEPESADSAKVDTAPEASEKSHRRGRAPRRPSPTLPAGAAREAVDHEARRQVAGGPTADDLARGADDAELRELREAERVLFPREVAGIRPGWSWSDGDHEAEGPSVQSSGLPPPSMAAGRAGVSKSEQDAGWLERLAMPNLPVRFEARVIKYLKFYRDTPRGRRIARAWARKSGRLTPALKAELAREGLPTDLAWISLIESGHNPTIVSPAGAAGLWQFIPESARMYGLTVDRWVDERLDPERSTGAAISYLKDLRKRFGNWELAMAAYNMGQGGLLRALRKFNTNDFWALSQYEAGIPWETSLYVPKIFAIAIVMNNKAEFGIDDVQPDSPISFDTVYVESGVSLSEVARAAEVPEEKILQLNGHFLAHRVPPSDGRRAKRWAVRVPPGRGLVTGQRLKRNRAADRATKNLERYVVRFGDTLDLIARERQSTERRIRHINHIAPSERLQAGTVLWVPPASGRDAADADEDVVVVPARNFHYPGRRRVFYDVQPGDTALEVARAFGVETSRLLVWNSLDNSARLQSGMTIQLFVDEDADLSRVRYRNPGETRILTAGTEEFFDYFEGLKGRQRLAVIAQEGDTLSTIGKRYGMSSGMMERINRFSRRRTLKKGDRVIVYAKRGVPGGEEASEAVPGPLPSVKAPRPDALPAAVKARRGLAPNGRRALGP